MVNEGTVQYLNEAQAGLRLLKDDPSPGDRAIANCMFEPYLSGSYSLVVKDSSRKGGFPDKVVLQVTTADTVLLRHDTADSAFAGDIEIPLGYLVSGEQKLVRIDLLAVRPNPGPVCSAVTPVEIRVQLNPGGI
jgi:hypothetical protein